MSVWVPAGALAPFVVGGAPAASNTLTVVRDTTPPAPVITTPGNVRVTDSTQLSFSIDFGEQVRRGRGFWGQGAAAWAGG